MSERIGLRSAKGSSTSGYVQKSLAHQGDRADLDGTGKVKFKNFELRKAVEKKKLKAESGDGGNQKQREATVLGKVLLDHERKREIELRVSELRDELEEGQEEHPDTWTDARIDQECEKLREQLNEDQRLTKRYAEAYKPRDKR